MAWDPKKYRQQQERTRKQNETDTKRMSRAGGAERKIAMAVWTAAYINDLPDGAFLYVESGKKDDEGKTVPRSLRHFPYKDAGGQIDIPHLRNAIGRIPQSNAPGLTPDKKRALQDKARGMLERAQA